MSIEPANPSDLPAIRWLLEFDRLPSDDLTEGLLRHFLVLRDEGQVLGVIGLELHGGVALLRSLVVAEEFRGRSHGAALASAAESLARRLGVVSIYLLTTSAEAFFQSRGYRRISRDAAPSQIQATTQFSALCPSTAVLMVKP